MPPFTSEGLFDAMVRPLRDCVRDRVPVVPAGPPTQHDLERTALYFRGLCEAAWQDYLTWRDRVERKEEPFSLDARDSHDQRLRQCLELFRSLDDGLTASGRPAKDDDWQGIPARLEAILTEKWVPPAALSRLLDEDEITGPNAAFFQGILAGNTGSH